MAASHHTAPHKELSLSLTEMAHTEMTQPSSLDDIWGAFHIK